MGLALLANALWGATPLYFKLLGGVSSQEILSHRVVWCAPLLWLGVFLARRTAIVWKVLRSPRTLAALGGTALLLAVDWGAYLHTVATGQLLQSSFGYFLAPVVSVLLGVGFFRERLRPAQWLAVGLAGVGILNLCLSMDFPWVGLVIAVNMALYSAARKHLAVNAVAGLLVETTLLLPVGAALLLVSYGRDPLHFGAQPGISILLVLSAAVTAAPLLAYVAAARRLPLSTLGVLQYLAPTCQLLLAVFLFAEPLSRTQAISFALVWAALVSFGWQSLRSGRAVRGGSAPCPATGRTAHVGPLGRPFSAAQSYLRPPTRTGEQERPVRRGRTAVPGVR
jgi:chloramphenicol-sensitive protein RarD